MQVAVMAEAGSRIQQSQAKAKEKKKEFMQTQLCWT